MVSPMGTERQVEFQVPSEAGCARICGLDPGVGTEVGMHVRLPMPGQVRAQWPRHGPLLQMANIFVERF